MTPARDVDRAVGLLHQAELRDRVAQVGPQRVVGGGGADGCLGASERGLGGPVDEVQPQAAVVEVVDAVIAEEVGIGEDDDAAISVLGNRRQGGTRRRGGGGGARDRPGPVG